MGLPFYPVAHMVAGELLLDEYGSASIAYSLRKLKTGVTNVIRVRRSSDSSEQDFTAVEVMNGALTTFTGAGDGFVATWYDQSGNGNDATQSTANLQPQIVSSGSVITDSDSKNSIHFSTIASNIRHLDISTVSASTSDSTLVASIDPNPQATTHYLLDFSAGRLIYEVGSTEAAIWDGGAKGTTFGGSDPAIISFVCGATTFDTRVNNAVSVNDDVSYTQRAFDGTISLGSNNAGTGGSVSAHVNEVVLWLSDKSSDISDIEGNMNSSWGRY
jgi:hypothetical protein